MLLIEENRGFNACC